MKYFTIAELSRSETARTAGIDNTPPSGVIVTLTALIEKLLDPIREQWGRPITVNSGYRSLKLNTAIKGAATSQHLRGEAADITAGSPTLNKQLFDLIESLAKTKQVEFDQVIDEKNYQWIHISYRAGRNRKQILHLK